MNKLRLLVTIEAELQIVYRIFVKHRMCDTIHKSHIVSPNQCAEKGKNASEAIMHNKLMHGDGQVKKRCRLIAPAAPRTEQPMIMELN